MKYCVGDLLISKTSFNTCNGVGLITREYESNGLRYEITFEFTDGQKRKFTYTADELEYRYSEGYGWTHYSVVK
jgi:hypothetical protein